MPQPKVPRHVCERAIEAVNAKLAQGHFPIGHPPSGGKLGAIAAAANELGKDAQALRHAVMVGKREYGIEPDWSLYKPDPVQAIEDIAADPVHALRERVRVLETENRSIRRDEITREAVRRYILDLKDRPVEPPTWLSAKPKKGKRVTGVPTLLCSDWHWGEVVKPSEVNWANEYDLKIAHARARKMVDTSLALLFDHIHEPNYPGAVLCLGGDMLSGNIHEELTATNDAPIMPCVVDLIGVLRTVIDRYLERFPRLYIPCVTGNHGRMTRKPVAKERNATNFDWLIYQMLALHYAKDSRVAFNIPDGADCYFNIYGHRYCLTHGDQFRGGDGITGAIMPIIRGRHKKSSRDTSIGQPWDTIVMGHWHTLIQLPHAIVNASLKGLDEYAYQGNFGFERAAQALWITHPDNGITFQMPVYVDERREAGGVREWVSWPKAA